MRILLFLAILAGAIWLAWPRLPPIFKVPLHTLQLARMEPPITLAMPVEGVKARAVADTWGAPRGNGRRHEGVDIFAARGTAVVSSTDGIVTRIGATPVGGNIVWVLGPALQRHYYAHLEKHADIAVGDRVVPGTVLGWVGDSGNARGTPPHLHYGVYTRDGAINPHPLLLAEPPGERAK